MKSAKLKLLCILHYSPPAHGAAKVGDIIKESTVLKESFDVRFVKIKSSDSIGEIGQIQLKKILYFFHLFLAVLWNLVIFRPKIIYFTASVRGVAFYRDYLLSILWRVYRIFNKDAAVYYHYHTRGISKFAFKSKKALKHTRKFIKGTGIILLSSLLEDRLKEIGTMKGIYYLPNGVKDSFKGFSFNRYITDKYSSNPDQINVLYLSNMIKSKGYFKILKLAGSMENRKFSFHFAGTWQSKEEEEEFNKYIETHKISNVVFHGFVSGREKEKLLKSSHISILPTQNDAFPLSLLEALSYGIPCLSTNIGAIPLIVDPKSGILVDNIDDIGNALNEMKIHFINKKAAMYCRNQYLNNFSVESFENNLVEILNG